MTKNKSPKSSQISNSITETVIFHIGAHVIEDTIVIRCPNELNAHPTHKIIRNGSDTSIKARSQQYRCLTCHRSFYAHTSQYFQSFEAQFRTLIYETFSKGKLDLERLQLKLHCSCSTANKIMQKVLESIGSSPKYQDYTKRWRNSSCLFIDETFITIGGRTMYLILILSGNNKIMRFALVETRDFDTILAMVQDCAARLCYGLKILVSDGFSVYKGVALALNKPIIHVRHIHQPPYGRIEIESYIYEPHNIRVVCAKTLNDITKIGGLFLAQMSEKNKPRYGTKKRGRKAGGTNRSAKVIEAEKYQKETRRGLLGHPKGLRNRRREVTTHVYFYNKKEGRVQAWGGSSEMMIPVFQTVFKQFQNVCITTNLVEKEFSVLKKLMGFRGRRTLERWHLLLRGYFLIRDEPENLKKQINTLDFSTRTISHTIQKNSFLNITMKPKNDLGI